jgi:hypothetical protein
VGSKVTKFKVGDLIGAWAQTLVSLSLSLSLSRLPPPTHPVYQPPPALAPASQACCDKSRALCVFGRCGCMEVILLNRKLLFTAFRVPRFACRAGVGCMVDSCKSCCACKKDEEQYCASGSVFTYGGVTKYGRAGPNGVPRSVFSVLVLVLRVVCL